MSHLLLVEDDLHLARTLTQYLQGKKISVDHCQTLAEAETACAKSHYEVVLLDRTLPDGDGLTLLDQAVISPATRVLVQSQRQGQAERLSGWRQGVDDYLEKPFSLEEWWWRVKRLYQVIKVPQVEIMNLGQLSFVPESGSIQVGTYSAHLRPKESKLLALLWRRQSAVVSRDDMIEQLWGWGDDQPTYATIDVYMRRIRIALGPVGNYLETVRGFGYVLRLPKVNAK